MIKHAFSLVTAFGGLTLAASSALALNPSYFGDTTPDFVNPWWHSDPLPALATSQQWDTFTSATGAANLATGTNNFLNNGGLAAPTVTATGISEAIYYFNSGPVTATIPNFGGPDGSLVSGGTHVIVQVAATIGANTPDFTQGMVADYSILPGTLHLTDLDGNTLPGGAADDAVYTLLASFEGDFEQIPGYPATGEHHRFEFFLPDYTGDFKVTWMQQNHSVFDALRVDTIIVPEPASTGILAVLASAAILRRRQRAMN
jgi:hypothetical protein